MLIQNRILIMAVLLIFFIVPEALVLGQSQSNQSYYKRYEGTIAGQWEIVMELTIIKDKFSGFYYIKDNKLPIRLKGRVAVSDNNISGTIVEFLTLDDETREEKGQFSGKKMTDGELRLKWTSVEKEKSFTIVLKEKYHPGSVPFAMKYKKQFYHYSGKGEDKIGLFLEFSYPQIKNIANKSFQKTVNEFVIQHFLNYNGIKEKPKSSILDYIIKKKIEDYKKTLQEAKLDDGFGAVWNWSYYYNCRVRFNENNLICLEMSSYEYTGGAHGLGQLRYYTFFGRLGSLVKLQDLFLPDYKDKLTEIANSILKKKLDLDEGQSLKEAHFFIDRLQLNGNFHIQRNGIVFTYNHYDIAPYSTGITKVLIPFSKIKGLINGSGPLKWVLEEIAD